MIPNVSRAILKEGSLADYTFDLIKTKPSNAECARWSITTPKGDSMTTEQIYCSVLKFIKQYAQFDLPKVYTETFEVKDGYIHSEVLTPERVAYAYVSLLRKESYKDMKHFKTDVTANGVSYDIIPNVPIRNGEVVPMGRGCQAFGRAMISAYAGVIADKDECRHAAWSEEYCLELGVKCFMLKYKACLNNDRYPYLDCALQAYHDWSYGSDIDKGLSQVYYKDIKSFFIKYMEEVTMSNKTIGEELGAIGVRGGHAVGDNVLPGRYGYSSYSEGTYVHNLSTMLSKTFGWTNLEPEEEKLAWSLIAKRGVEAGCNTILYNHTNFSLNSKGEPNSGTVLIIYPFENEKYKSLYKQMAAILAKHMELSKSEVRVRKSTTKEDKNYYSAIHYGKEYGIKHPLIVEYGYHVDVAGREDECTEKILMAYVEMLETMWCAVAWVDVYFGSNDTERVMEVQQGLLNLDLGIDLGKSGKNSNGVDGDFGSKTLNGIHVAQDHFGLDESDVVNKELYYLLCPDEKPVVYSEEIPKSNIRKTINEKVSNEKSEPLEEEETDNTNEEIKEMIWEVVNGWLRRIIHYFIELIVKDR